MRISEIKTRGGSRFKTLLRSGARGFLRPAKVFFSVGDFGADNNKHSRNHDGCPFLSRSGQPERGFVATGRDPIYAGFEIVFLGGAATASRRGEGSKPLCRRGCFMPDVLTGAK